MVGAINAFPEFGRNKSGVPCALHGMRWNVLDVFICRYMYKLLRGFVVVP